MTDRRLRTALLPLALAAALAASLLGATAATASIGHTYLCQITGDSPGSASECHAGGSATPGGLVNPYGLTLSNGNLSVADQGNASVDLYDSADGFLTQQTGGAANFSATGVRHVAVNDSTQFSYVADAGFGVPGVIDVFDNTGAFVTQWNGSTTPTGSFNPNGVAVDNSTGPSSGDVYVSNYNHQRVDKLDPSGNFLSQLTGTPAGDFGNLQGVATDSAGDIYAIDENSPGNGSLAEVDEYDQAGTFIGRFTGAGSPTGDLGDVSAVTVDAATGHLYIADTAHHVVNEFDSSGNFLSQVTGGDTPAGSFSTFNGSVGGIDGLAVDSAGDVYVSDNGNGVVDKFGPDVPIPDATTGPPTNVAQTSATLNGSVNPGGTTLTDCHFDYVDDADYNPSAPNPYAAGATIPCASTPTGSSFVPVSADLTGLQVGTLYHYRTVAANQNGTGRGQDQKLLTQGPGFGIKSFDGSVTNRDGSPDTQAGSHPYQLAASFEFNTRQSLQGQTVSDGNVKDIQIDLPAGLSGDTTAVPQCTYQQLVSTNNGQSGSQCPAASQVGVLTVTYNGQGSCAGGTCFVGIFNMVPPPGEPAELGALVVNHPVFFHVRVRSGGDYGLTTTLADLPTDASVIASSATLWGVPADPSHDSLRGQCLDSTGASLGSCPSGTPERPFFTLPTSCAGPQTTTARADSWQDPGNFVTASFVSHDNSGNPVGVDGCNKLQFNPSITVQPDSSSADSAAGLHVDLHLPPAGLQDPNGLSEANLKKAVVTLPAGTSVNPASADGLQACSSAEVALHSPDPATCPDASKIGSVEVTTPILDHPLDGGVFLAKQTDNPFGSLLAIYIAIHDPTTGVVVKLAGHVVPDPQTGQLETTFDDNPQLPFTDFKLDFFGGPRAPLATPVTCGSFQTTSQMVPWSAVDPNNPQPGEIASPSDSFQINSGPGGGSCVSDPSQRPLAPGFSAGTVFNGGGSYSPFVLKLTRSDGEQNLTRLDTTLPPGVLGKLAGIPECSDAALGSISQAEGTGASEQANPACPAASQLGSSNVGAGAGPSPLYVGGRVYLAGPYKGAPISLAIVTPAIAGPIDLGSIVVRVALYVDPATAQITARSDQIPTIVHGIPLRIRDIRIKLDRPNFTLNPTSCDPMAVTGTAFGSDGAQAALTDHYQASGCGALPFAPRFSAQILNGSQGIHRSDHPNLVFNLHANPGDANVRMAQVLLPSSFQIDQANLGNICSETELANTRCAGRNTVGTATATTPLLDYQLSGPVYAVSGSGGLPKLAVILNGPPTQPVQLILRGVTTTVGNRIANTFATVPDAPVTDFSLSLKGGPTGYLVNNTDVCAGAKGRSKKARKKAAKLRKTNLTSNAIVEGQNGKTADQSIPISAQCPKAKKKNRHAKHKKH